MFSLIFLEDSLYFLSQFDFEMKVNFGRGVDSSIILENFKWSETNLVNVGDKVLSLVIGNFGKRWAQIAKSHGADVEIIEVPYGQAIDPNVVRERLQADVNKEIKIVTVTHNETSTGVTNPLKDIMEVIREQLR